VLLATDDLVAPPEVRFGIGAWPAVAAAVVAHLLYLLARPGEDTEHVGADVPAAPAPGLTVSDPNHWWDDAPGAQQVEENTPPVAVPALALVPEQTVESDEDLDRRAAELVAAGAGRVQLERELGVSEHKAKTYVRQYRQEART
jgi:hypothetical protein